MASGRHTLDSHTTVSNDMHQHHGHVTCQMLVSSWLNAYKHLESLQQLVAGHGIQQLGANERGEADSTCLAG